MTQGIVHALRSLRHDTSADAPITTSPVQISPHRTAGPCPADVVARWASG